MSTKHIIDVKGKGKMYHEEFDSGHEYVNHFYNLEDYCKENGFSDYTKNRVRHYSDISDSFYGITADKMKPLTKNGWDEGIKKSDEILSYIEDKVKVDTQAFRVMGSPAGGAVNVPATLANSPMSMRLRRKVIEETNPINVYIDIGASCATDKKHMMLRGSANLALVRVMSQVRPVVLNLINGFSNSQKGSGYYTNSVNIRIDTTPIDLATASFYLTRPEMLRRVGFAYLVAKKYEDIQEDYVDDGIPPMFGSHDWQVENYPKVIADFHGDKEYIATPRLHGPDHPFSSMEKAGEWVETQVKKLTKTVDDW